MPPDLFPGPAPIRFGRAVCGDLAAAAARWWIANGRGGYAGGTIALVDPRYHALLVAPVEPPLGRVLVPAGTSFTLY